MATRRPCRGATPRTGDGARSRSAAARSARVRRRRRILLGIGGALVVVVLAFVLWYELESHALGPPGRRSSSRCTRASRPSTVIDALSQQHVIGSSLAFQISEVVHGTPTVAAGELRPAPEPDLLRGARPSWRPARTSTRSNVRPGFTLSEVAQEVDSLPGHAAGEFAKAAASGAVHSTFSPPGSNNLEGMLGTGHLPRPPR